MARLTNTVASAPGGLTVNGVHSPLDTTRPHPARRYDYWLGGKDHFAADRASGDQIAAVFPTIRTAARENRCFLQRVVTSLAVDAGIRQFLDLGCGLPTTPAVHEVAQRMAPAAGVVYVDNDPVVIAHTRGRTTSGPACAMTCLLADLRHPAAILASPALQATIDLTRPVAVLLVAVLHLLTDEDHPEEIITNLVDALPSGSYLALSHATLDPLPDVTRARVTALFRSDSRHGTFQPRTRHEVASLIEGLPLIEPGLVPIVRWRPDVPPHPRANEAETAAYGAVTQVP